MKWYERINEDLLHIFSIEKRFGKKKVWILVEKAKLYILEVYDDAP